MVRRGVERGPGFEESLEVQEEEAIENIERLPASKDLRMNLVLTWLGEKPTTNFELKYNAMEPVVELEEVVEKKEKMEKNLKDLGLNFKILKKEWVDERGFEHKDFEFLVGREEENVKELEKAWVERDNRKLGKLFGFPETAVEAYSRGVESKELTELMGWWRELPKEKRKRLKEEKVLNFINFRLSKEHWEAELKVVRKWQEKIKDVAPHLYQEIAEEEWSETLSKEEMKEKTKKELEEIRKRLEKKTRESGTSLEEGVKETVVMLNAFDLRTERSYEAEIGEEEISPPRILIRPREPSAERWRENKEIRERVKKQDKFMQQQLISLLNLFYREREVPSDAMLDLEREDYGFWLQSQGVKILEEMNDDRRMEKVKEYEKEMRSFTEFLKERCPKYLFHGAVEG